MDRIEYTTSQDIFHDFCLWEYVPSVPYENKFRSVNLLYNSFEQIGVHERFFDLVQVIREGMEESNTVWGVKRLGNDMFWELYFYDYGRRQRTRSITRLLDIIRPFIRCKIKVNENYPYFMFSIDINGDLICGARELEEIHMYIGNPGSTVSSGICYSLTAGKTRLENFYFFFNAETEMDEIMAKTGCSALIDSTRISVDQILWPELKRCKVMVVANKQENDSVYFSRINVDQLIFFLHRMEYPEQLVSFVEANQSKLDHLQFDVGFDYRMEGRDLVILKSAYYGFF
jgi:hypothetical protein